MDKVIATVNERGVVTLPLASRKQIGITKGGQVQITVTDEGLLVTPVVTFPVETYTDEKLKQFASEEAKLKKFKF
ncbi:MAG: AbrB/MazE/SpoVT family DNA-binding domain-containing protein [Chloracidobacterium sp.]|nr:AbrB/MazE/SpoVT family DNA-binding domain-containing protein [Chloracidobacterium sp.]